MTNEIVLQIIQTAKENNSESLNLSGCSLTEIPKEIFDLKSLKTLSLRDNQIKIIPKEIKNLKNLSSLSFASNLLEDLPNELFEL